MTSSAPQPRGPQAPGWLSTPSLVLGAVGVFFVLALAMRALERSGTAARWSEATDTAGVSTLDDEDARAGRVPGLVKHLQGANLVTSVLETSVRVQAFDENWRGTAVATVETPVRLHYAIDLAALDPARVIFSPLGSVYTLRVPLPRLHAVEVRTGEERVYVEVGGWRLRSRAGEYQLGLARTRVEAQARRLRPTERDQIALRAAATQALTALVRGVVGPQALVRVLFEDAAPATRDAHARREAHATSPDEVRP